MGQYRIAELNCEINTNSTTLGKSLERYETSFDCAPNLILSISDDRLLQLMTENEGVTADRIECNALATLFSRELFDFNGFPMRSIAVENGEKSVLFSSPYANNDMLQFIPPEKIFCADFPAVRQIHNDFFVYDTPFGERAEYAKDNKLAMTSIVFVDSRHFDSLKKIDASDYVPFFMKAVSQNIYDERTKHTLFVLEKLSHAVNFFGVSDLSDLDFILERV